MDSGDHVVNIATYSEHQPDWLNYEPLQGLADSSGLTVDKLNYVLCLLAVYPLSLLFHLLPTSMPNARHFLGLIVGFGLGLFCFRIYLLHVFISSLVTYLIILSDPKSKYSHWACMVFGMAYLVFGHTYRQYWFYGSYSLDYTGPQMILTQKLTSLAYALHDGRARDEKDLNENQRTMRLTKVPNLLEFFGHVLFFPGFLAGPVHQIRDYLNFIHGTESHGKSPSGVFVALKKLLIAIACIAIQQSPAALFGYHKGYMNGTVAFGRDLACLGDPEFIAMFSLPYRVLQMMVGAMIIRFNYYFAWTLADGANNLAGFGYQVKKDKEGKETGSWDRITNVDIAGVELALNLKGVLDCWNIQTNRWLRYTMYERVKSQAVMKTMLLSAMWHGTYPGYYFTFGTASFATEAARKMRRAVRPMFQGSWALARFYDLLTWAVTSICLNYLVGPFVLNSVERSTTYFAHVYFIPTIVFLAIGFAPFGRPVKKEKKTEKKTE